MKKNILIAICGLVAGSFYFGDVASTEAGYFGKRAKAKVVAKNPNHRIFVPAHWDEATQSWIYPEFISMKPHTPGHKHYTTTYRAVRVHYGMTSKWSRPVDCDIVSHGKYRSRGKARICR